MSIPDKAVEAAWAAHYETPELDRVSAILDAAAPFIAAHTLREMADSLEPTDRRNYGRLDEYREGLDHAQMLIRDRADELEEK